MKKILSVFLALILTVTYTACGREQGADSSDENTFVIAGKYVYYDEELNDFCLKKGNICVENGLFTSINEYDVNGNGTLVLKDNQIIFPGMMDLHSHTECNMIQMFTDNIVGDVCWDNRFEWRYAPAYFEEYKNPSSAIMKMWNSTFEGIDSDFTVGDMVALYSELQAVSGGTVTIQEDGNEGDYDFLERHRNIALVRSTSCGEDIARNDGLPMESIVRLYKPDAELTADNESTYMPPIETDWGVIATKPDDSLEAYIDIIIDSIKDSSRKTAGGYLVHLSEGRAGNLSIGVNCDNPAADIYSGREFEVFMQRIKSEVAAGNITYEDLKDAGITLIHACGIDLSDEENYDFIKDCGISLLWSPVSNLLLYKDTPNLYDYLDDDNIRVSIGSDWSPSGSKTVWDECKFALEFIKAKKSLGEEDTVVLEKNLLKAVTVKSAEILGSKKLGNIAVGKYADIFILDAGNTVIDNADRAVDKLFSCDERSVKMVYVGGRPTYGDKDYIDQFIHDEELVWVNVESTVPELTNKYYNITGITDEDTFYKLFDSFRDMLMELDCPISLLRSSEDAVYLETIKKLEDKFI